ncbi:hypothetical protein DSCA_44040 [Desulfosarcina alkanivorans]|uniref:DUF218 domain-containing protein n=2 Tax=Desulfosarcina alkanivorans TaxID=571177 RepID=A0A5K7YVY9_9BACT|nr:hypothetical protein DSCA_44040 [Desulfosarcina alkanivorans]
MFEFKKIVTPLILPPGIVVVLIVLVSMMMGYRKRWKLALVNLTVGFLLYALSTGPVATFLIRGLESDVSIPENPSGDVIILLGGGIIDRVPDLTGTAAPSPLMMGRIVTAVRLYQRLGLPIIVTGGRVSGDAEVAEAPVVRRFLVDLGVPGNRITLEDRARDTAQNARLTAAICRQQGFSRPILLTAAYHLKRAGMAFDAAGMTYTPFPAYYLGARNAPYTWRRLLPGAGFLSTSANALHEYIGIVYYRMVQL